MKKKTIISNLFALVLILFFAPRTISAEQQTISSSKGFFISLDALKPKHLKAILDAKLLTSAKGFSFVSSDSFAADEAWPEVTITAASHVSTITCSPPNKHGIVANFFLRGGKPLSGFSAEIFSETMVHSAMKQGHRVISIAYPAIDGTAPNRSATIGLTYPDYEKMANSQTIKLTPRTMSEAKGWDYGEHLIFKAEKYKPRETSFLIRLNPATPEIRKIYVLVVELSNVQAIYLDSDKNLGNGYLARLNNKMKVTDLTYLTFTERFMKSTMYGVKRRAYVRIVNAENGTTSLYVSRPSYNPAYPEAFRKFLDDNDLIWPDIDGDPYVKKFFPLDFVEMKAKLDEFMTDVARIAIEKYPFDIILFYQPLLDSLGHAFQRQLLEPIDIKSNDLVTKAYIKAYQLIDKNINLILAKISKNDVIALMGDHGMDSTYKEINLAALKPFQEKTLQTIASGGLALIYSDRKNPKVKDSENEFITTATNLVFDGKKAIASLKQRGPESEKSWNFGDANLVLYAAQGFAFTSNPTELNIFVEPRSQGSHGHDRSVTSMATTLFIKGKGINTQHIAKAELIDVVPTFAKLLKIKPPEQCVGRPIF